MQLENDGRLEKLVRSKLCLVTWFCKSLINLTAWKIWADRFEKLAPSGSKLCKVQPRLLETHSARGDFVHHNIMSESNENLHLWLWLLLQLPKALRFPQPKM